MKQKIYSVYDSKMEAYMQPFFQNARGQAIRSFSDAVNDPKAPFYKHPGDFTLFEIGEYDDQDASVTQYEAKQNLGTAIDFKEKTNEL